jgi:hypothetical protein
MNFKKNKYIVIKKAINKEVAQLCYNYLLIKRQVAKTLFESKYISPFETMFGVWNDAQVPNTYSHYSDILMETLLLKVKPILEKNTNTNLIETYSYARIYKKGDVLNKHKDRFSCEISTTLNLGGDKWPIYLKDIFKKNVKIILNPGDMLIYKGNELEHWRDEFLGEDCCQVFLHYNNSNTKESKNNIFDGRRHLGLPVWFKK